MKNVAERDKTLCCGCGVCTVNCPKQAIVMKPDRKGFLYPEIDNSLCIQCGRCVHICAFERMEKNENIYVQGFQHFDSDILKNSTSGGFFTAASDYLLDNNGVIYSVGEDESQNIVFFRYECSECRDKCRGARYVQASFREHYEKLRHDLLTERFVLVVGTPCQINAIRIDCLANRIPTEKLILIDLVCHGVGSPVVFKEQIKLLEDKYGKHIVRYFFRTKDKGWHGHFEKAVFQDGSAAFMNKELEYQKMLFGHNLNLRESCFNCKFTSTTRTGDITIGDFWGLEKICPEFLDENGTSMLLVNTNMGAELVKKVKESSSMYRLFDASIAGYEQPQLKSPAIKDNNYNLFWSIFFEKGYEKTVKIFTKKYSIPFNVKVKILIKKMIGIE